MNARVTSHRAIGSSWGLSGDLEVLHAGRVYPDGDPVAVLREKAEDLLREAQRLGLWVLACNGAQPVVQVSRAPRAGA